jgi:twitching motility protein PilT
MTPQQNILKVLLVHNKLATEQDFAQLIQTTPDPEDVIAKLVLGEMIPEAVGEKLLALYQHNLKKQGLGAQTSGAGTAPAAGEVAHPAAATAVARDLHGPAHPAAHAGATVNHTPPRPTPVPASKPPVPRTPAAPSATAPAPLQVSVNIDADDRALLFELLQAARNLNASDLHVKSGSVPVVRIATHLHELALPALPAERVERALKGLMSDRDRETYEQTNDLDCSFDGGADTGRFRLNVLRQIHGVDGTFRLIPDKVPSFDDLRLPLVCKRFTQFRQGIVLVTGPKGSGKTTTLAALIDLINQTRADHIITIEDPIEFVHPSKKAHVNQREVGVHTQSFANALRASLREAPDVIMVGEMRDLETVSLAITAAETGHLVFGTLHTPNAPRTVNRVVDVFPPEEQGQIRAMFSESLRGIISQFLIPSRDGRSVHLATEILFNSGAMANLIRENRSFQLHGMMQTHHKQGMHLMDETLLKLVQEGKIAKEEAIARADNVGQMERDTATLH